MPSIKWLDFKFGVHVNHCKSKPADDKLSLKGMWLHHVTHFKFLGHRHDSSI